MARALYIHWPFCLKKCPYCDFNSHVRDGVDHDIWQSALIADMDYEAELAAGEELTSIFFGGGTPSLMPPALVAQLIAHAERKWGFAPDIEITLEANPSSVEAANFADLAKAGVNRVSLGLQSLNDERLQFLGRLHSVEESLKALDIAQRSFGRVSCDLIYAQPGQSEQQWRDELTRAIGFGTDHLSLYQLTIEPNTRFATDVRRGVFAPLGDDPSADLFEITRQLTEAAGLPAYEVSNHAKPAQESRHNLTYWRYQDYIGIGPGAHGRRNGRASLRHKKPENWTEAVMAKGHGIKEDSPLKRAEQASEALLMGLRLAEGINSEALGERFGFQSHEMIDSSRLKLMQDLGLVWAQGSRIGVTSRGMPVLDGLLGELVNMELVTA